MIERILETIRATVAEAAADAAKKAADDAYAAGYKDATERMHEMYCFGMQRGYTMAMLEVEEDSIEIEDIDDILDPSVFQEEVMHESIS